MKGVIRSVEERVDEHSKMSLLMFFFFAADLTDCSQYYDDDRFRLASAEGAVMHHLSSAITILQRGEKC